MSDQDQPTQSSTPPHPARSTHATWPSFVPTDLNAFWQRVRQFWYGGGPGTRLSLIAAAVVLVVSCSVGGILAVQHAQAKPDGYLWTSSTGVVFVLLTEDTNGHLSGMWHTVYEASDQSIKNEDDAFTGVANDSHVNITFSVLGFASTITGTLNGDSLILQVPDQNGYIATDVFHAASVQDYNNAAALLRQHVAAQVAATQSAEATVATQQAEAQARATAQAGLDQAVTNANSQLSGDLKNISSDVQTLLGSSDFSDALNAYSGSWSQMQTDYQKEQSDYQQGCGQDGYNANTVSYDANTVSYDLNSIQYDDNTLSYDENTFNPAFAQVQSDMKAVQADWQNLQAAVAADTTASVSAQFTANDVNAAVTGAQNQIDASNKALADAQSKAAAYDKEAAQMNTNAQNLANGMHC